MNFTNWQCFISFAQQEAQQQIQGPLAEIDECQPNKANYVASKGEIAKERAAEWKG